MDRRSTGSGSGSGSNGHVHSRGAARAGSGSTADDEPSYPGEDTRPTSTKELAGWYMYGFASETYVICGMSLAASCSAPGPRDRKLFFRLTPR